MKYKIILELKSPMIIGGKKLNNNYIKSIEYIPGSVLRAAFSREITERCPLYDYEKSDKKYWVQYRGEKECNQCKVKNLCQNFSNIKIHHSYPLGSKVYPLTAMRCKEEPSHMPIDTLIERIKRNISIKDDSYKFEYAKFICRQCGKRVEKCSGFYLGNDGKLLDITPIHTIVTKNSVNPYLKVSKEGMLYSLDTLNEKIYKNDEKVPTVFEGTIEGIEDKSELEEIESIRVGAYNTAGFGEIEVKYEPIKEKMDIKNLQTRIEKLNKKVDYSNKIYVPITLASDAYLGLEKQFEKNAELYSIATKDYKEAYSKILDKWIPKSLKLVSIIAANESRRGFDTSSEKNPLRSSKIVTKAGSIFVYEADINSINYKELLELENSGIGYNTMHGFGDISIADDFHIMFSK